jgi:hypothetical protein
MVFIPAASGVASGEREEIGRELSVPRHLRNGEEFRVSLGALIEHGRSLFSASWTEQEGAGRTLSKGNGSPLSDMNDPLVFPRSFNRISGPDSNSCAGCHNAPFGTPGGGGDFVTNVFVLGQRFDFATFDHNDFVSTKGAVDESGKHVTQDNISNQRSTLGMYGSGYIEMLSRQITGDLQAIRDGIPPGGASRLVSKGISFGTISRTMDGRWDVSRIEGLPKPSTTSTGQKDPPSLIVLPFHQSGSVVSLRQFTNNAFNHHHGIQSTERFGENVDADGDGFKNEITRADVTAVTIYQATLPVPGRVIPSDRTKEAAIVNGERLFHEVHCTSCHIPSLPLDRNGWIFSEPNPYNPAGNLRQNDAPTLSINLASEEIPGPRLKPSRGIIHVPAFTDFKLHDITAGPSDPNRESLDLNELPGSPDFFAGNSKFVTRKLWGVANEPPYFHHGRYTTLRQSILAHAGEASSSAHAFRSLNNYDQSSIVEFLKTLQILPPNTKHLVVDERGNRKDWRGEFSR